MTSPTYYRRRGSWMSADLKRTAHRVRQHIDSLPVTKDPESGLENNPRKRRLVHRASLDQTGKPPVLESPGLAPRARHALAWRAP